MNDKQLAQIEEWLTGQKRFKLLDTERKGLLKLKGSLLQIWLAQYLNENDDQESWLSIKALMELTGLSEHTVIEARKKLTKDGWARCHAGKTAAQKYEKPTRGAHKVSVYSVDDPSAKNADAKTAPANVIPPKNADKVSGSGSSSGSNSTYVPLTVAIASKHASLPSLPSVEGKPENQKPTAKPILPVPVPNSVPPPPPPPASASRKKVRTAKDGTPWPGDFNSWTNVDRTKWLHDHSREAPVSPSVAPKQKLPQKPPVITPPSNTAAPPNPSVPEKPKLFEHVLTPDEARKAIHEAMEDSTPCELPVRPLRPKSKEEIEAEEFDRDWSEHWTSTRHEKLYKKEPEDSLLNETIKKHEKERFRSAWERQRQQAKLRAMGFID